MDNSEEEAVILQVTVAIEVPALVLWRAESGADEGKDIGVIALLLADCVSRIVAAASTDRTCTHVALQVFSR